MSLDPMVNFGKIEVSAGYNSTVTTIELVDGQGTRLPSSFSFNLVWWNWTDFPDPSDAFHAGEAEIVRCSAGPLANTITIARAQEGTSAIAHNTADKTYKMILSFTKKTYDDIAALGNKNLLINGEGKVSQRGSSFVSGENGDDVYTLDRWNLLSDGSDIVDVTQSTESPTGALNSIGLDVETASKKFGILQIIEQKNAERVIGDTVTLSFKAKVTSAAAGRLENIKAVVLSWDSTADIVTSDVVSAWGVEDTTPTWATNWTEENTPVNLNVTDSWASYSVAGISIDTVSTKNIAVFIWADGLTGTVTDFLHITDVQLEKGDTVSDFESRSIETELTLCQRYFAKSYNQDVSPGSADGGGRVQMQFGGNASSDHTMHIGLFFPATMRTTPSITAYAIDGTSGKIVMAAGNVSALVGDVGEAGCRVGGINGASSTLRNIEFQYTANAEL